MNIGKHSRRLTVSSFLMAAFILEAAAQISGTVSDKTNGEPVENAFITGLQANKQVCYTFSGHQGDFSLPDTTPIETIRVSMMGFESCTVVLAKNKPPLHIELKPSVFKINAATARESVIKKQGDTTVFLAQSFRNGMEKNVGELLEKLPGITVSSSGGILHDGQYINKFYVEGMDMMGGRYGVITKNLNADDIARIELYEHHQPIKALSNVRAEDRSAINIILKDDVRNTWVASGDLMIGAPTFPRFETRAMLSRFGKKTQTLLLAKGNNTGIDIDDEIREQTYFGKTGAFLITPDIESDFTTLLSPSHGQINLPQEYWYNNLSGLLSLNHMFRTSEDGEMKLRFQGAAERYKEETSRIEVIHLPGNDEICIEESDLLNDTKYYFSGSADYTKNARSRYVNNELSVSGQYRGFVSTLQGEQNVLQNYRLPSLNVKNNLQATFKLKGHHALNLTSNTKFISNHHSAQFTIDDVSHFQNYHRSIILSDNALSYARNISGHRISTAIELGLSYTGINSSFRVFSVSPGMNVSDTFYLGPVKTSVSLPFGIRGIFAHEKSFALPQIAPSLRLEYPISSFLELTAGTSYHISRSKDASLYPEFVRTTYRTISHSDSLAQTNSWRTNLSLRYSDVIHLFYASISAAHYSSLRNRKAINGFDGPFQRIIYENSPSRFSSFNIVANLKKYFGIRTFVIEIAGGFSKEVSAEVLQGKDFNFDSRSLNAQAIMQLHPAKWISLQANGSFTHQWSNGSYEGFINSFEIDAEIRIVPYKSFILESQAFYRLNQIPGMNIYNQPLVKLKAGWQFSKFTISAECRNLLDVETYRSETISSFRSYSTTTGLRGRYYIIGILMRL